jgi:hypothetical protein
VLPEHYRQWVGLIIAEGTYPTNVSRIAIGQPDMATDGQQAGW